MQLISLGTDKAVKVWDLRNQKCLQTITPKDWISAEDAHPTCLAYDSERQRLVSSVGSGPDSRRVAPRMGS